MPSMPSTPSRNTEDPAPASQSTNTSTLQSWKDTMKMIFAFVFLFTAYDVCQFQRSTYSNAKDGYSVDCKRDIHAAHIPLPVLTRAEERITCPLPGELFPVKIITNATAESPTASGYLIPRIFHQTGEGKCLTKPFLDGAEAWAFEGAGFSFYFHDAQARKVLLEKHWPEFPQLQNAFLCLKNAGGAAIADLWRYLALWEYGGFYTDMDNLPGQYLTPTKVNEILAADMDAFFLKDFAVSPGFPSQQFFGVSPRHPILYYAVYEVLQAMLGLQDVGTFYVPETTGPSALARAFLQFMEVPKSEWDTKAKWLGHAMTQPKAGLYTGAQNRQVNIVGGMGESQRYIRSSAINGADKTEGWKKMNYTNYHALNKIPQNKTCLQVIMEEHTERHFTTLY